MSRTRISRAKPCIHLWLPSSRCVSFGERNQLGIICKKIVVLVRAPYHIKRNASAYRRNDATLRHYSCLPVFYCNIDTVIYSNGVSGDMLLFAVGRLSVVGGPFAAGQHHADEHRPKRGVFRAARVDAELLAFCPMENFGLPNGLLFAQWRISTDRTARFLPSGGFRLTE